jgi:hypothetical protein
MTRDEYQGVCRRLLAVTNEAAWARRTLDGKDRLDEVNEADVRYEDAAAALHDLLALEAVMDGPATGDPKATLQAWGKGPLTWRLT